MNRDKAIKLLRENMYLVNTITNPPMVVDIEMMGLAEHTDPEFETIIESCAIMVTLEGREAYELAKELCPKRRSLALPDGSSRVISEDIDTDSQKLLIPPEGSGEV